MTLITLALFALISTDRFVDVGGSRLHIRCAGERTVGAPLVVLEAGLGRTTKTWDNVFEPIAHFARVCAYDRQGMGLSEGSLESEGINAVVERLRALLRKADEPPPYVMAGHSWGGALVRYYATVYSSEVTGLVLIDSTHEEQTKRFGALNSDAAVPTAPSNEGRTELPSEDMESEMSARPWHANIPLVVLTHSPSTDPIEDPRLGVLWLELQRELATRSPQAEHIVAQKGVGHFIHNQQPELVIDAVQRVVAMASRH
jgi:pimeloyl-ACP methyl ester carboxylesterase